MDEKVIPHLVARFLSWKLPHDFRPDAGISFVPEYNNGTPEGGRHEPSGTNLLNAEQAFAMFRYVLEHPAVSAMPERELLREALEALEPFVTEAHTYDCDDDEEGAPEIPDARRLRIEEADGTLSESIISVGDFRRARAAADKIRAALTQEKQR